MSPEAMAQTAVARGIDAVVITEHDALWSQTEVNALQAQFPKVLVLRGIEVSVAEGHALMYGAPDDLIPQLWFKMPLTELTEVAHDVGALVYLAHPTRYNDDIPDSVLEADIDGVEAYSLNVREYMADAIEGLHSRLGVPRIAGTDAHLTDSLGYYSTEVHTPIASERDLVDALRSGEQALRGSKTRIKAYNATVAGSVAQVQHLLREGTLSRREVKATYGHNFSFQDGVARGKDLRLRVPSAGLQAH